MEVIDHAEQRSLLGRRTEQRQRPGTDCERLHALGIAQRQSALKRLALRSRQGAEMAEQRSEHGMQRSERQLCLHLHASRAQQPNVGALVAKPGRGGSTTIGDMATTHRILITGIIGRGGGRFSFIHIDDAVSATLHAIDGGWGAYNVVDDQPTTAAEFIPALAEALGAPAPRRIPAWLARPLAGRHGVRTMTTQRGASNRRAKAELGWRPEYPSWREGIGRTGGAPATILAARA
jgi:hypothetical protein